MKRKIFTVLGIVIGAVVGLFGGTAGVLALMGKFKTPVVYAEVLEFENNNQVVIADSEKIYSFMLNGANPNEEHEVNQKDCKIWFIEGSNLIQLCDKDGVALSRDSSLRYTVQCNEKIYFKLKDINVNVESENSKRGLVQLRALNSKTESVADMKIWIDRRVDGVFVNYGTIPDPNLSGASEQRIVLPMSDKEENFLKFEYVSNPLLALNPIGKESAGKSVELYYDGIVGDENDGIDDYLLVTPESVASDDRLNSVLEYKNGDLLFKTTTANEYSFIIAVFKTFDDKLTYERNEANAGNSNFTRVNSMASTNLTISVVNSSVERVVVDSSENVVLNLFSKKDYITLNGVASEPGAKNNNLNVQMYKDGQILSNQENFRLNEVKFGNDYANAELGYWNTKRPNFEQVGGTEIVDNIDAVLENGLTFADIVSSINLGTITFEGENCSMFVVNKLILDGSIYCCNNGAAVALVDEDQNIVEMLLLKSGTYMDMFFKKDGMFTTVKSSNKFEFELKSPIGENHLKSWNIVSKSEPKLDAGETLNIGILVVNNDGMFEIDRFFASKGVTVNPIDLSYEIESDEVTLEFTKTLNGAEIKDIQDVLPFDDLITIESGSYNACVLMTEQREDDGYPISVVDTVTYTVDEKTYVLVGYFEGGMFVNAVRSEGSSAHKIGEQTKLKLLQLKNGFDEEVEDIIKENLDLADKVVAFRGDEILVDVEFKLHNSCLELDVPDLTHGLTGNSSTDYVDGIYSVYEKKTGVVIYVIDKSGTVEDDSSMLDMLYNYYGGDETSFKNALMGLIKTSTSNVEIVGIEKIDGTEHPQIQIICAVGSTLTNQNETVALKITDLYDSGEFDVIKFKIVSSKPESLSVYGDEIHIAKLSSTPNADNPEAILKVTLDYDEATYLATYKLEFKDGSTKSIDGFNAVLCKAGGEGIIVDENFKDVAHEISYYVDSTYLTLTKKGTYYDPNIEGVGKTEIAIECGGKTWYLPVEISTELEFSAKQIEVTKNADFDLKELLSEETKIAATKDNISFLSPVCVSYGKAGVVVNVKETEDGIIFYEGDDETKITLTISDTGSGWRFTREAGYKYTPIEIAFGLKSKVGMIPPIVVNFISEITIKAGGSEGNEWEYDTNKNAYVFYKGTTVYLYSFGDAYKNPLLNISSNNVTVTTNAGNLSGNTIEFNQCGNFNIEVKSSDSGAQLLGSYPIVVKENLFVDLNGQTEFTTGEENAINVKCHKTTDTGIVYGTEGYLTYGEPEPTENFAGALTLSATKVEDNSKTVIPTISGSTLTFGHMTEIGTYDYTFKVVYRKDAGSPITFEKEFSVKLTNQYTLNIDNSNGVVDIVAMVEQSIFTVSDNSFVLTGIQIDGRDDISISVADGKFTIPAIKEKLTDVTLNLTFSNGSNTLTYTTTLDELKYNILPYKPTPNENINAFSEQEFDLLDEVYTIDSSKIQSVKVVGLYETLDSDDSVVEIITDGGAYNNHATLPAIDENEKVFYIEYELMYKDINNITYTYRLPLTIKNCQTVSANHLFDDLEVTIDGTFTSENNEEFTQNILGKTINYEPLLMTNAEKTISFVQDDFFPEARVNVSNEAGEQDEKIERVELVAWQSGLNNHVQIDGTQVKIRPMSNNVGGHLIFKVVSLTGAYDYYDIYVYSDLSGARANTIDAKYKVASASTIESILSGLKTTIENATGVTYNVDDISVYLLGFSGANTGLGNANLKNSVDDKTISSLSGFATLKLALVRNKYPKVYCFAVVNLGLYSYDVEVIDAYDGDGTNDDPNVTVTETLTIGEYEGVIKPGIQTIEFPFSFSDEDLDSGWSVALTKEDGNEFTGGFASTSGADISITQYITGDSYEFIATYTHTNGVSIDVSIKVKYTYVPITAPTDLGFDLEIGAFDTTNLKFQNTYSVQSLLGDYKLKSDGSNVVITIDGCECSGEHTCIAGSNVDISNDNSTLTFAQTHEGYEVTLKFVLEELDNHTFTQTFKVLPGYYEMWNTNASGTTGNPLETTTGTINYESETGSYIAFTTTAPTDPTSTSDNAHALTVDGSSLTIYSSKALTPSVNIQTNAQYGIVASGNEYYDSTSRNVNFVHMARDNQVLALSLTLKNGTDVYGDEEFFVRLAQTYSGLKAKYAMQGAGYESVEEGTEWSSLFDSFFEETVSDSNFKNATRVVLLDLAGNEVAINTDIRSNFGLDGGTNRTNGANPNKVIYSLGSTSGTSYEKYTFSDAISSITEKTFFLTNASGVEGLEYTIKVIPKDTKLTYIDFNFGDGLVTPDTNTSSFIYTAGQSNTFNVATTIDPNESLLHTKLGTGGLTVTVGGTTYSAFSFNTNNQLYESKTKDGEPKTDVVAIIKKEGSSYKIYQGSENKDEKLLATILLTSAQHKVGEDYENKQTIQVIVSENLKETLTIQMNVYGSGTYALASGLTMIFNNLKINESFTGRDEIYATHQKVLLGKNGLISLSSNGDDLTDYSKYKFVINSANISYLDGGRSTSFEYNGSKATSNDIYMLDGSTLKTRSIGYDYVDVDLNMTLIYDDDVSITNHTFSYRQLRNHKFLIDFKTELNADNVATFNNRSSSLEIVDFNDIQIKNYTADDGNLYLNFIKIKGDDGKPADLDLSDPNSNLTMVVLDSNYKAVDDDVLTFNESAKTLTIKRDFDGDIIIRLTYDAKFGDYVVDWKVNVKGMIAIDCDSEGDNKHHVTLKSGEKFTLVQSKENPESSAQITLDRREFNKTDNKITVTYSYKLVPHDESGTNADKDNSYWFGSSEPLTGVQTGDTDVTKELSASESSLHLLAPTVAPSSSSEPEWFVVYKVVFTYGGRTSETYYVAYYVKNEISIKANSWVTEAVPNQTEVNAANVNVDDLDSNKLGLFSFTETIKFNEAKTKTEDQGTTTEITTYDKIKLYVANDGTYKVKAVHTKEKITKTTTLGNVSENHETTSTVNYTCLSVSDKEEIYTNDSDPTKTKQVILTRDGGEITNVTLVDGLSAVATVTKIVKTQIATTGFTYNDGNGNEVVGTLITEQTLENDELQSEVPVSVKLGDSTYTYTNTMVDGDYVLENSDISNNKIYLEETLSRIKPKRYQAETIVGDTDDAKKENFNSKKSTLYKFDSENKTYVSVASEGYNSAIKYYKSGPADTYFDITKNNVNYKVMKEVTTESSSYGVITTTKEQTAAGETYSSTFVYNEKTYASTSDKQNVYTFAGQPTIYVSRGGAGSGASTSYEVSEYSVQNAVDGDDVNLKTYSVFETEFASVHVFKESFLEEIDKIRIRKDETTSYDFDLIDMGGGLFGINLSSGYGVIKVTSETFDDLKNSLYTKTSSYVKVADGAEFSGSEVYYCKLAFVNELKANICVVINGAETYNIPAQTDNTSSGFRLFSDNTITAKEEKAFSSLFAFSAELNDYYSKNVIGVTDDKTPISLSTTNGKLQAFVKGSTGVSSYSKVTDIIEGTYELWEVVFTGESGSIYETQKSFYVIVSTLTYDTSSKPAIYSIDYSSNTEGQGIFRTSNNEFNFATYINIWTFDSTNKWVKNTASEVSLSENPNNSKVTISETILTTLIATGDTSVVVELKTSSKTFATCTVCFENIDIVPVEEKAVSDLFSENNENEYPTGKSWNDVKDLKFIGIVNSNPTGVMLRKFIKTSNSNVTHSGTPELVATFTGGYKLFKVTLTRGFKNASDEEMTTYVYVIYSPHIDINGNPAIYTVNGTLETDETSFDFDGLIKVHTFDGAWNVSNASSDEVKLSVETETGVWEELENMEVQKFKSEVKVKINVLQTIDKETLTYVEHSSEVTIIFTQN